METETTSDISFDPFGTSITVHEDPTRDKSAILENGVDDDTPTAMVQKATWNDELTVIGTLNNITEKARNAGVDSPAVTVVGDVVDVHKNVADWLGGSPSSAVEEKIEPRGNEALREHCQGEDTDSRGESVVDTDYGVVTDRHAEVFDP